MVKFASLVSGSSGNATFVSDGMTNILVDCGMSGKALAQSLESMGENAEYIDALLITHEHIDHIKGAGVISRKYNIPIYATERTHASMDIGKISAGNKRIVSGAFEVGTISVTPFSIPHDAADPVGYSLFADGEKITVATDIGHVSEELMENLMGSDRILLEANHDIEMLRYGSYPYALKQRILGDNGHMSNDLAAECAARLAKNGTRAIMLGHLSNENNYPQIAYATVLNRLRAENTVVDLCVADRFRPTPCVCGR